MTLTKTRARLASSVLAGVMLLSQLVAPLTVGATNIRTEHKIDICHGTASYSNPYVKNNVDQDAADGNGGNDNGQGDHYLEHQGPIFYTTIPKHTEWGDIIPPIAGVHTGLNWTTEGQAIYNNNCNFPAGKVEVNKKVDANGDGVYEGGNTTANTLGFRWALDNEAPTRMMGTDTSALAGAHTVTEKMVSGYVFTGWYYTTDTQYSCANPRGTTLPVDVTVVKNETKKVTLCNQAKNGNITIIKDAQPNDGQDFYFTIDKTYSAWGDSFTLDDDGNTANTHSNTKSYDNLLVGTYVVKESDTLGWKLADITCSEGADVTVDKDNGKAYITLGHDDSVTCTFVNQKKGKLTVYKHTVPAGDQTKFAIEATGTGSVYDPTRWIADGEHEEFVVSQGTYSVNETLPAGWTQSENTCKDVVVSADNLYPSCYITNSKAAKLTIKKEANPQSEHDFEFESDKLGYFKLDNDGDNGNTLKDYKTFTDLAAGNYAVREQETNDWHLDSIVCTGTRDYSINWEENRVSVNLKGGDDVTCKFVNEKLNKIFGHKFEDVNNNRKWDKNEPALEGWTITLKQDCDDVDEDDCDNDTHIAKTDQDGEYEFEELLPGDYVVCEKQQDGWMQTYPTSEKGCHEIEVDGPGEEIRANFGNFKKARVLGVKFNDINGNGKQDANEPNLKDWTISLYKATDQNDLLATLGTPVKTAKTDDKGAYSFGDLTPGTYKVCETQKANWTRTFPAGSDCHEFTVTTSGQVVTASFGNKPKPQVLGAATTATLVNTGSSASKQILVGLSILGALGALHLLTARRKDYAK